MRIDFIYLLGPHHFIMIGLLFLFIYLFCVWKWKVGNIYSNFFSGLYEMLVGPQYLFAYDFLFFSQTSSFVYQKQEFPSHTTKLPLIVSKIKNKNVFLSLITNIYTIFRNNLTVTFLNISNIFSKCFMEALFV